MAESSNTANDGPRRFELKTGETANHKVDALLDLLEKKGVINASEAAAIRVAKIY